MHRRLHQALNGVRLTFLGLLLQPQRVRRALLELRAAALVFFSVLFVYDRHLPLPVFDFVLKESARLSLPFEAAAAQRLHSPVTVLSCSPLWPW